MVFTNPDPTLDQIEQGCSHRKESLMRGNWFWGLSYNIVASFLSAACIWLALLIHSNARHRELALTDRLTQSSSRLCGDLVLGKIERRRKFRARWRPKFLKGFQVRTAVIEVDIDHFKAVNDTYGHPAGDFVLQEVAKILKSRLRHSALRQIDRLVRPGGEEFRVILPGLTMAEAMAVAERMRHALDTTLVFKRQEIKITGSFGVALFTDATPLDWVLGKADRALYRAKIGGRNRVEAGSAFTPPPETPPA
jgi:diguanylate cyclase (GGDEF)-like protein